MSVSNERGEASSEEMSAAEAASSSEATPQKMKKDIKKKAKKCKVKFDISLPAQHLVRSIA